jgi:hypothetical protein
MDPIIRGAILVLPVADPKESLNWWIEISGFKETFRDTTPPNYAGINRGEAILQSATHLGLSSLYFKCLLTALVI